MADERSRTTPTASELAVWRDFVQSSEQLRRAMAAGLQKEAGISPADYSVLLALFEASGRQLRSSVLADEVGWERSRVSHHLGRMERKGLITREGSASDNRVAEVSMTAEGLRTFRRSSASHFALIRSLFVDALTPDQLVDLEKAFSALRAHLREREVALTEQPAPPVE